MNRRTPLQRFVEKCRFVPGTGCVIWTGGKSSAHAGEGRMGVFKYEGKRWTARRWAARFIHGQDISEGREAVAYCGEPLCVRHVKTDFPAVNTRQHWLLVRLGYGDDEPEDHKAERLARERVTLQAEIPAEERGWPEWLPFPEGVTGVWFDEAGTLA